MPGITGFGGTFRIGSDPTRKTSESGIRSTLSPEELALHDAGELIPESGRILAEDIESGKVVVAVVADTVGEVATTLQKPE